MLLINDRTCNVEKQKKSIKRNELRRILAAYSPLNAKLLYQTMYIHTTSYLSSYYIVYIYINCCIQQLIKFQNNSKIKIKLLIYCIFYDRAALINTYMLMTYKVLYL